METRKTCQKQTVENTRRKACRKATDREKSPAENLSQVQKSSQPNIEQNKFVIVLCFEFLNYYEVLHWELQKWNISINLHSKWY